MNNNKTSVIIPAAGIGKRMGGDKNKLLLELGEGTVLDFCIKKFQDSPFIDSIILVVSIKSLNEFKEKYSGLNKIHAVVAGGTERTNSVINGFNALPENVEIVLIHDAARPFVSDNIIKRVVDKLKEKDCCTAAMLVKDTIKVADENLDVKISPDRSKLWLTQTPQGFKKNVLENLIKQAEKDSIVFTDECQLAEKAGIKVALVEGDYTNFKITTAEDILFARALLTQKQD